MAVLLERNGEFWVEDVLDEGWIVGFRLKWTGVDHVIDELRVFRRGPDSPLPPDGLTARRLRSVRFEAARTLARQALEDSIARQLDPEGFRRYLEETRLAHRRAKPRTARRGAWTDADYVELAARYVDKVRDGARNPVAQLAGDMKYSPARIRQALKYARDRGWLTKTTRRRPGGALTPEALAIVRREKEET